MANDKTPKTERLPVEKIYLAPGDKLSLHWEGRIGPSGTIVDIQADAGEMSRKHQVQDPNKVQVMDGLGRIERDGYLTVIFLEEDTGRFWYDDNGWWQ